MPKADGQERHSLQNDQGSCDENNADSGNVPLCLSTGNALKRGDGDLQAEASQPSALRDAKKRARLKRQFVRNQWLDINKAPSWPPIRKNRVSYQSLRFGD